MILRCGVQESNGLHSVLLESFVHLLSIQGRYPLRWLDWGVLNRQIIGTRLRLGVLTRMIHPLLRDRLMKSYIVTRLFPKRSLEFGLVPAAWGMTSSVGCKVVSPVVQTEWWKSAVAVAFVV